MTLGRFIIRTAPPLAALILAGCVSETATTQAAAGPPSASTGNQCFFSQDINSFQPVNDRVVNLRVGVNTVYQAELFAPCPDIKFSEGVALRHTGGGGGAICSPLDAEFIVPSPIGAQTCALTALRRLSPQEVAALPPGQKP